jgi:hypothetical protein
LNVLLSAIMLYGVAEGHFRSLRHSNGLCRRGVSRGVVAQKAGGL